MKLHLNNFKQISNSKMNILRIEKKDFLYLLIIICCFYVIFEQSKLKKLDDNKIKMPVQNTRQVSFLDSSITQKNSVRFKYDLSHLTQTTMIVLGPIQDDEALLVYGLIKTIRPKTVIECGMGHGYSTVNILKAIDEDARLYTFDIEILNKNSPAFGDKRFKFIAKSQSKFEQSDIENKVIDFIYLDNGHYFDVNVEFWKKVMGSMSENAIMVIHDTGLHIIDDNGKQIEESSKVCDFKNLCGKAHCPPGKI
jgi:predicted O-methyltransferase YrrM